MIYIHIPFCRSFCIYCGFYSETLASLCRKTDEAGLFRRFSSALCREIASAESIPAEINSLYIGGGTPSVLPPFVFSDILRTLATCGFNCGFDEFTVEVNPEDVVRRGRPYLDFLKESGVNRISMGVQSFNDRILKWMNRRHDSAAAGIAFRMLREAGFDNISIDLIFGVPSLDSGEWLETVRRALDPVGGGCPPEHISAYQLSVEPDSALERLVNTGREKEVRDEICADQYEMLSSVLKDAGYRHYEISNFAFPGREALHNSSYWKGFSYAGFGPGAHSFAAGRGIRFWNSPDLKGWLEAAEKGCFETVRGQEILTLEQQAMERIMLALRTDDGIDEDFLFRYGNPAKINGLLDSGILVRRPGGDGNSAGTVCIDESHFFVSDSIIAEVV